MNRKSFLSKKIIFLILLFAATLPAFSETDFLTPMLSVEAFSSLSYGNEGEKVYKTISSKEYLLSYLDWEEKFLPYFGAKISGHLPENLPLSDLTLSLTGKWAIPGTYGIIQDFDWTNHASTDPDLQNLLTCFSHHECVLRSKYEYQVNLGYNFKCKNLFCITPYAAFYYMYSSHVALNGYGVYGNSIGTSGLKYSVGDADESHIRNETYTGNIIELERLRYDVWTGFSYKIKAPSLPILMGLDFALCPFSYVESLDSHNTRGWYFLDKMSYGLGTFVINTYKPSSMTFSDYWSKCMNILEKSLSDFSFRLKLIIDFVLSDNFLLSTSVSVSNFSVYGYTYNSGSRDGKFSKSDGNSGADFSNVSATCGVRFFM